MSLVGRVHSIESFGTVDGPGIRYVAFMQGCLMRCLYCHNRDTWDMDGGEEMTVDEMMKQVRAYRGFYLNGGVTASGGEATLQAEYLAQWFKECQAEGIHTCLDTNGMVRKFTPAIDDLLAHTDLVLLDIKQMDAQRHIDLTKVGYERTLQFAEYLHKIGKKTWIRYVVVPGYSDAEEDVQKLVEFVKPMTNVEKIELLPYHELGKHKWATLGDEYKLEGIRAPSPEVMERIKKQFTDQGLNAIY